MEPGTTDLASLFSLRDRTIVITGGAGALGGAMARALAAAGARVAVLSRHEESSAAVAAAIQAAGGQALGMACDVRDPATLVRAAGVVTAAFGAIDALVNAAGGNQEPATTTGDRSFFDIDPAAVSDVLDLNFTGTLRCCQVFGRQMAERGSGCIVNIASMSAIRPLTRIPAYSAAKAALVNFTQWLAVHLAQEYGPHLRVNALAPGFFLTEQNRYLLTDSETGAWSARAEAILAHTPQGRFGAAEDLVGPLLWLASPAAAFVTGIVVPVDGGFAAYSGV
jgi:NAD(P)-dependent dehydrogenase (short-subunit alcohol dehydrogenase family)